MNLRALSEDAQLSDSEPGFSTDEEGSDLDASQKGGRGRKAGAGVHKAKGRKPGVGVRAVAGAGAKAAVGSGAGSKAKPGGGAGAGGKASASGAQPTGKGAAAEGPKSKAVKGTQAEVMANALAVAAPAAFLLMPTVDLEEWGADTEVGGWCLK